MNIVPKSFFHRWFLWSTYPYTFCKAATTVGFISLLYAWIISIPFTLWYAQGVLGLTAFQAYGNETQSVWEMTGVSGLFPTLALISYGLLITAVYAALALTFGLLVALGLVYLEEKIKGSSFTKTIKAATIARIKDKTCVLMTYNSKDTNND